MTRYLYKELHLAASPISWWFLAGALMTLLPGYPILVGSFFICFGVFQSFQHARESNDVLYSVLLPSLAVVSVLISIFWAAAVFNLFPEGIERDGSELEALLSDRNP